MPEQVAGEVASQEWTPESVEKQAAELEQPKPEAQEAESEEARPEVKKVVPLTALHEERNKRREAAERARNLEQQNAQLMRQMQEVMQRLNQSQQPQEPGADDPIGQLNYGVKKTQAELEQIRQQQQATLAAQQQAAQQQQFFQAVRSAQAEYVSRQSDAIDGIEHWKKSVLAEYEAAGLSRGQAEQRLAQDQLQLSWEAMQRGDNPAEVAYNRALARGYVPAKKKLEMQKEGQGASMPTGGSGKSGGPPSLEALLKMPTEDFGKATEGKKWEQLLKKYM